MKNSETRSNRLRAFKKTKFHWSQYAVIAVVLAFLTIQALPNFYGFTNQLTLSSTQNSAYLPTIEQVKNQLAGKGIVLDSANASGEQLQLLINDKQQFAQAKSHLSQLYDQEFEINSEQIRRQPLWLQTFGAKPIKLGLDLSGGVLFVLEVDHEKALAEMKESQVLMLKQELRQAKLRGVNVELNDKEQIVLTDASGRNNLISFVNEQLASQQLFSINDKNVSGDVKQIVVNVNEQQANQFRREVMAQSIKTMRGRIEELGITEAVTQQQGKNRIRIELPGIKDPHEAQRIIGATASLAFYQMANGSSLSTKAMRSANGELLRLDATPIFTGNSIEHATNGRDQIGNPSVNLRLDTLGGKRMANFTKDNVGNPIVTVYTEYRKNEHNQTIKSSKVINVARISEPLGASFSITNMESAAAAHELALVLRAGSLTAPVTIVKQRTIQATLGEDNIEHGITALAVGLGFTLLFMMLWYRELGLIANGALALNLLSLLGLMSLLPGAVLTLPGIAGLVLTVGMAVDTNVLIFERIKEELRKGRTVGGAIEAGYQNAFTAIFDANLTTMITALILYAIGYGPVKGFALTLSLGILTSLFTGVFVAKVATLTLINPKRNGLLGVK
ncbi:protein translocase subunit SecD [Thalassotalea fusca]